MAYVDPYDGSRKGVLGKFTFKRSESGNWDNDRASKDVSNFYNDEYAVGLEGDLDYEYNVERFDEEGLEGNAWVWISSDDDVATLKSHASFIGTSLLKDVRK